MSDITRRSFLKQGGATAAAAGALVAVPKGLSRTSSPKTGSARRTAAAAAAKKKETANRHLVVHVPDTRKGELRVLVGEREVVIHDRELVSRLTRAAD